MSTRVLTSPLPITQRIFFPLLNRVMPFFFLICARGSSYCLKQTFYETSAPTFLIDWHLLNQPTKITSLACFFSMQIFRTWENCTLAGIKNSFYLLKIKQSVQSYLTSCEIKGDVEGYFCWRRRQRVFEKTATRCSSFNILARRARI